MPSERTGTGFPDDEEEEEEDEEETPPTEEDLAEAQKPLADPADEQLVQQLVDRDMQHYEKQLEQLFQEGRI
jgi:hypothetical protein